MRTEPAYNIKSVDGVEVVEWRVAETGISRSEHSGGMVVTFDGCEMLLLADGTTVYGCTFPGCIFTAASSMTVAASHYGKVHQPRAPREFTIYLDWSLRDLLETVHQADAAIKRLMDKVEALKADRTDGRSKKKLERLEQDNEYLRDEVAKLAPVRDALSAINKIGG